MDTKSFEIVFLAELNKYTKCEPASDGEYRICCPYHDDKNPSCFVNPSKNVFSCKSAQCGKSGNGYELLAKLSNKPLSLVMEEFDANEKTVEPQVVEKYHSKIWDAKDLLHELYKRGVTDDLIRKYRLGEKDGRITIPIKNKHGAYVNVRSYLPGAPSQDKMRNMRGRGNPVWYPIEQLNYDTIVLCGGELKAIVAAEQLNKHNIGCIYATVGENLVPPNLMKDLDRKIVYVCFDIDQGGVNAAEKNCKALQKRAKEVYNVKLPLDPIKYPKGDINDFVVSGGDLYEVVKNTPKWEPTKVIDVEEEPLKVHLNRVVNAEYVGKRIKTTAVITAMDISPYVIPKEVMVFCDRNIKECNVCPVWEAEGETLKIPEESPAILEMVSTQKHYLRGAIMSALGIPHCCKTCQFHPVSYYNAEDVRISPQLEITNRSADQKIQPAICLGEGLEMNESYEMIGRMYPNPKSQQSTLIISKYSTTQDALSTYECKDLDRLVKFQPKDWSVRGIEEKLKSIYTYFEHYVTRIFQRQNLHLIIDLAYHSPLLFTMDKKINKGWVEVLIVGDSSNGKTETALGMMNYYGLGERLECKNATVAGLLGGVQQLGTGRWFITWGFIPRHDKRLVILEELKGTPPEVISKLTDMRSSGVAEISKIEKQRTYARTRIIGISNPRSDRPISAYSYGIEAIKELIHGLEDIRRFDVFLITCNNDVDLKKLNKIVHVNGNVEKYENELCRSLILWAWTRDPSKVVIDDEVAEEIMQATNRLCDKYTDAIPILDKGSARYKIARLAISLACRTFSCTDDLLGVKVRPCHVQFIEKFLDETYSSKYFGYKDFTESVNMASELLDPDSLQEKIASLPFPHDFVEMMLRKSDIELQDLQDWSGWDRVDAAELLSIFVRKHALVRDNRGYRKTPSFISFLKEIREAKNDRTHKRFIPSAEF